MAPRHWFQRRWNSGAYVTVTYRWVAAMHAAHTSSAVALVAVAFGAAAKAASRLSRTLKEHCSMSKRPWAWARMEDEPGLRSTNIPETVRKSSVPGKGGAGPVARVVS
jgi:hypothetical protein